MNQKTIALVSPFHEPVCIKGYGGTERVVYESIRLLSQYGYNVHVFGAGEPVDLPEVTFHQVIKTSLRAQLPTDNTAREFAAILAARQAWRMIEQLNPDLILNHAGVSALLAKGDLPNNLVTILHNNQSHPTHRNVHLEFIDTPVVSISQSQRKALPQLNYVANVYNGIPVENFTFIPESGQYLTWLGRMTSDKGPDLAIDIAVHAGMPLIMAGIVDQNNKQFFEEKIAPRLERHKDLVKFIGEVNHQQKNVLLGGAFATLVPNRWAEPFGLMMVESMATGTPVIATNLGSIPELITPEVGIVVSYTKNEQNLVNSFAWKLHELSKIDRNACRARVTKHFSSESMVQGYADLCESMLSTKKVHRSLRVA